MEIDNNIGSCDDGYVASRVYTLNNIKAKLRHYMENSTTLIVIIPSISIALSYLGTYVAKYPLFLVDYDGNNNEDTILLNIPLKDWLSYAFTVGFFIGKWPAYKFVPSITRNQRLRVLVVLFTLTSFFFTAFLPLKGDGGGHAAYYYYYSVLKIIGIFIGSVCCSAIFGIEFTYLEGRANGDSYIAAVNCVVFFGSSLCRAVASAVIRAGSIEDCWMPLLLVTLYAPITLTSLFCLDAMPNPTHSDIAIMGERTIMLQSEKSAFISNHIIGLCPLLVGYAFACGFRFLRDFFALEVYREVLGRDPAPIDYILADWVGGALCIALLLGLSRVTDNTHALFLLHFMFAGGGLVVGVATLMFERGLISPELWIILIGVGLMATITPFSGSLFDRIMACTKTKGTATFLINFGDAVAYVGVFSSLAYKSTRSSESSSSSTAYLSLFLTGCHAFAVILLITGILSAIYWRHVLKVIAGYESVEVDEEVDTDTEERRTATASSGDDNIELTFEQHRIENSNGIAKRTRVNE